MVCSLTVVAMIHYLWIMFGSSALTITAPSNLDGQYKKLGSVTSAEDGLFFKTGELRGCESVGISALSTCWLTHRYAEVLLK